MDPWLAGSIPSMEHRFPAIVAFVEFIWSTMAFKYPSMFFRNRGPDISSQGFPLFCRYRSGP